ncbi:hypothetical protein M422DRAFT_246088 [Sphaerobolus stellatus SS14]|nr:hypothetical protein M422DRAFT_246088 [Sphaerobolus stellatus SS14]
MRFTSVSISTAVCVILLTSGSAEARPYPAGDLALRQTEPTDGCGQPGGRSCN